MRLPFLMKTISSIKHRRKQGFIYIECLIAALILAVATAMVCSSIALMYLHRFDDENLLDAKTKLSSRMSEEIFHMNDSFYYKDLTGKISGAVPLRLGDKVIQCDIYTYSETADYKGKNVVSDSIIRSKVKY